MKNKPLVAVAMSGGVDSSVAAALLVEQGYDVVGIMLRLWSQPGKESSNRCCTTDSMALARQAASQLKIPFYVINAQQVFYQAIVKEFVSGYAHGITPNPCINCNRQIRFGFLFEHARALGAEFLSTGHYARKKMSRVGKWQLMRSVDRDKDQSYVLHVLTQDLIAKAIFPIGDYTKDQVRQLAIKFNLPSAARPDSQDLCFLAGDDYRDFLRRHAPDEINPGEIVTKGGSSMGIHDGLANFTIGQRKGLGFSSPKPYYVVGKDYQTNKLVVGNQDERRKEELIAETINWVDNYPPRHSFTGTVKIRYKSFDYPATIIPISDSSSRVKFFEPVMDITPGQAAVFYDDEVCLGGGIIATDSS